MNSSSSAMGSKQMVGLLGILLSALAACSEAARDAETKGSTSAATVLNCTSTSDAPCTPDRGSDLREEVVNLLRYSLKRELTKNGVVPSDDDIGFVFQTMLVQSERVYVAAQIVRSDGKTPFDLAGTSAAGKSNTVQALMDLASISVVSHTIGVGLEQKAIACDFVEAVFNRRAPGIYDGDMQRDCDDSPRKVDDECFLMYVAGGQSCGRSAGNDGAALEACLVPVRQDLQACCTEHGGSTNCAKL